jgi:hypothetical protein
LSFRLAREFVSAGGTLITLAHTNKHKDLQGKSIHSGTSDIKDDSDCVFIIDRIGIQKGFATEVHTVEFSNDKARGDVASTIGFSFEKRSGTPYIDLLDSVKQLSESDIIKSNTEQQYQADLERDATLIQEVLNVLTAGVDTKKDALITRVREVTCDTAARVRKLIEARTGSSYEIGHRWTTVKGANNALIYQKLPPPYE